MVRRFIFCWPCQNLYWIQSRWFLLVDFGEPSQVVRITSTKNECLSSTSLVEFNNAYDLCISVLTSKPRLACEVNQSDTQNRRKIEMIWTSVSLVNRLFSTALDTHAERFKTYRHDFSIHEYNRQRGFYRLLPNAIKQRLQECYK